MRAALSQIDPHLKNVRWIQPAQLHLTLGFIGNVDKTSEEALIDALDAIFLGTPSFCRSAAWAFSAVHGPLCSGRVWERGILISSRCTSTCKTRFCARA
jgi:hypothetical protein